MIIQEEKLGGIAIGLRKYRIKELKQELKYLNCQEMRTKGKIESKETVVGIAIFTEIDPQARQFEVMIGGLVDVVKHRYQMELEGNLKDKLRYEYEVKIWKITYTYPGDEYYTQVESLKEIKKERLVRNYGPIGDKNTILTSIKMLENENELLRRVARWILRRMTDENFDYNPENPPEENKESILRWQEWWYINKGKLVYNLKRNKFEVKESKR